MDRRQPSLIDKPKRGAQSRRPKIATLLAALALGVALAVILPARAAIELAYFTVQVSSTELKLDWATAQEYNVEGFEVFCRAESEPISAYHSIGTVIAQGSPTAGAPYTFDVVGLEPDIRYCFRITELTTDGTPGESFDRCGYGLGITPTPQSTVVVVANQLPGQTDLQASGETTAGIVSINGQAAEPTPLTLDPINTPTPSVFAGNAAPQENGQLPPQTFDPNQPAPTVPPIADPNTNSGQQSPLPSPLTETPTPLAEGAPLSTIGDPNTGGAAAAAAQPDVPTPLYIVVTSTPTPEGEWQDELAAAPVFTPLPIATPGNASLLAGLSELTTENILLATLCVVFFGASSIGVLGITSLGLYLRSRADKRTRR